MRIDDSSTKKDRPAVFRVKSMSSADFEFAVEITDRMGWGLTEQDFEFMMELEPKGCFVLLDDLRKVGIATTISFGKIGWFGNLIVDEKRRNKGAGSSLVKHALEYLSRKNVKTVGLYAYVERIPFYERLGFGPDLELVVLKGKGFSSPINANVKEAGRQDIAEIVDFDRICFGASRRKMLEAILSDSDNLCCTFVDGQKLSGYAVAKVFRGVAELGPLMCMKGQTKIAVELLKSVLNRLEGFEISVYVPKKETAILSTLTRSGFREDFRVERMYHGPPIAIDGVWLAESLERG